MYVSLAHALGSSRAHLVKSNKNFCALLKHVRSDLRFHRSIDGSSGAHGKPAQTDDSKREREKYRETLHKLVWQSSLGSTKAKFVAATPNSKNRGVRDATGKDVDTPHDMFVDDDLYANVCASEHALSKRARSASRPSSRCSDTRIWPPDITQSRGIILVRCQSTGATGRWGRTLTPGGWPPEPPTATPGRPLPS